MSLPTNDKKGGNQVSKGQKNAGKGSKFIQTAAKAGTVTKKVRATSANRGS